MQYEGSRSVSDFVKAQAAICWGVENGLMDLLV